MIDSTDPLASPDVRALLRAIYSADRYAAVFCACACARTALHLLPDSEHRPRKAIEAAEAWARGEESAEKCAWASAVASTATGSAAANIAAENAAYAASYVAAAAAGSENWMRSLPNDVISAVDSATDAIAVASGEESDRERHLDALYALVSTIQRPLRVPTKRQILGAPEAIAVAWDTVAGDTRTEQSVLALVEAHGRAIRLGLDWNHPLQRAIAERTTDEEGLRALLCPDLP